MKTVQLYFYANALQPGWCEAPLSSRSSAHARAQNKPGRAATTAPTAPGPSQWALKTLKGKQPLQARTPEAEIQASLHTPAHKVLSKPQTRLIHGEHVLKLQNQPVQVLRTYSSDL